jgi:hypothetical protein
MLQDGERGGGVLSAAELCLDDEEARPGSDGNDQERVHRCANPACHPLLEAIRVATNHNKMSVWRNKKS